MATLLEGLKSKSVSVERVHKAYVNEQKNGYLKCTKPNGDQYGLVTNLFVKRIDDGEIIVIKEDVKSGIIEFKYNNTNPFA